MDFFGQQEKAQRRTLILFLLFACAIVCISLFVYVAIIFGIYAGQLFQEQSAWSALNQFWSLKYLYWTMAITLCVIAIGSLYKITQLRDGGGAKVAEMLGGKRLLSNIKTPLEKRTLNIVEEMAIASGLPVPPVYILPQSGINAFAAGFTSSDAVLGITQGAMEMLNRDELQGVVGHEFSHILHGDMRINMSMTGLLHGITLISDAGMMLLTSRSSARYSKRRRGSPPSFAVVGLLLFLVGLIGMIMADLIKLAVSRQREFLADASAVQFTRNPNGIANALKVMGGYKQGTQVKHGAATSVSHFFFAYALKRKRARASKRDWWATHPPLEERIRRIEPRFRARFDVVDEESKRTSVFNEAVVGFSQHVKASIVLNTDTPESWVSMLGNPQSEHILQAQRLLAQIPSRIHEFAHDSYTARAVCYALLLNSDADMKRKQMRLLEKLADANVMREMLDIQVEVSHLDVMLRLPLLDILLPALKSLSFPQYQQFIKNIDLLIKADHQVDMFEYTMKYILLRHLKPSFMKVETTVVKYHSIQALEVECACVLALLIGLGKHQEAESLFADKTNQLLGYMMPWPPLRARQSSCLNKALLRLQYASPSIKKALLTVCSQVVLSDGELCAKEFEALRAIAEAMDCPMPPLIYQSKDNVE